MSRRDVDKSRRPASTYRNCHVYLLWIIAAAFCVVAIKIIAWPRKFPALSSNLHDFEPLNSFSPVAAEAIDVLDIHAGPSHFHLLTLEERAVVTTLYSESSASSVLALGHSLRATNTSARRILIYYPHRLEMRTMCYLQTIGWELYPVAHPNHWSGEEDAYLKFQAWSLHKLGIKQVVYLENDILVRRNFDEIWSLPFLIAGVPWALWNPQEFLRSFDASMLVLRTSFAIYDDMIGKFSSIRQTHTVSFEEFVNKYFATQVVRLPFFYNADVAIKQYNLAFWSALTKHIRMVRYTAAKPFFEDERRRAVRGIWGVEMEWWDSAWRDTFKEVKDKC